MSKQKITDQIRVRSWDVMSRAVEEGVVYGWNRAHKYTDHPGEDVIKEAVEQAVMSAISEFFDFTDAAEEQ